MNGIAANVIGQIDALQARYVHALDNRDLQAWVDTFDTARDSSYFCISAENEENGLPIALMYDDCRDRIEDRVVFIEKIWVDTFQDYRSRHFIECTHCEQIDERTYALETNFAVLFTPETGRTGVQVSGVYKDRIIVDGEGARFRSRRAVYDTTILPRYIVYPF